LKQTPYSLYIHLSKLTTLWSNSNSKSETILKCGLISIELSTSLIAFISKRKEPNAEKLCHKLLEGIERQFSLLNQISLSISSQTRSSFPVFSKNIEYLKLVDPQHKNWIDRITKGYFDLSVNLGVELGLGSQMNAVREAFQLPTQRYDFESYLDYHSFVEQDKITQLSKSEYYNSEDALFMTVHQISECWFKIIVVELNTIQVSSNSVPSEKQTISFNFITEVLSYLSQHIFLLEYMVLSDYHPLRVALRGASGGQSHQAHEIFSKSKKIFKQFITYLEQSNLNILTVLEAPTKYKTLLEIIQHFEQLERALKTFFFNHYLLSSNVIGSQSFGSIGYELVSLADKFVAPVFPEIDQAKYDFTLKTNFLYGNTSGILILEKEVFNPTFKNDLDLNPDLFDQTIKAYFEAISNLDSQKWVQLFEEDGYLEDPTGSRPYIGHKELGIFFKGIMRTFSQFNMKILQKSYQQSSVDVHWEAKAISYNNKTIIFNGKEVFRINATGKITAAQVFWDPSIIAQQL
jgi:tryptophan 2,3-dioxygenase